jgi:hypothetical protein
MSLAQWRAVPAFPCHPYTGWGRRRDEVPGPLPNILQHILLRQAEVAVAGDDQVVVDRQVQGSEGLHQGAGQYYWRRGRTLFPALRFWRDQGH